MSVNTNKRHLSSRVLSPREKLDAIRRVHTGETKASVARQIGVPESTLRGWCKNEGKITYLSRQFTTENDESSESPRKIAKLETSQSEAYNLSVKNYSSSSTDAMSHGETSESKTASELNLPSQKADDKLSESAKNRAELARLSIELGLHKPEIFNTKCSTDITNNLLLAQWNALLLQQQLKNLQANGREDVPNSIGNNIFTNNSLRNPDFERSFLRDFKYWTWLKYQQSLINMTNPTPANVSTPSKSPTASLNSNSLSPNQNSWFSKCYAEVPHKNQEMAQKGPKAEEQNAENLCTRDYDDLQKSYDKTEIKARSALDNLLLNSNNFPNDKQETELNYLNKCEAIEHGEKFLKWLESCQDPSITAVQTMHFKTLLNSLKSGIDRNGCDLSHKAKVRRK